MVVRPQIAMMPTNDTMARYSVVRRVLLAVNFCTALVAHPLSSLEALDTKLIMWWGALNWLPAAFKHAALEPTTLWLIWVLHFVLYALAMLFVRAWPVLWLAVGVSALVQGVYVRGFGGHVNHQELTLLYATAALALTDALLFKADEKAASVLSRIASFAIRLTVTWQYFLIGVARLAGAPSALLPNNNTMDNWLIVHGVKWNWWTFDISELVADHMAVRLFFRAGLIISTIFEIASPFVLFSKQLRAVWLPLMLLFHVGIWLTMNILFWQNIALLFLFFDQDVLACYKSWSTNLKVRLFASRAAAKAGPG